MDTTKKAEIMEKYGRKAGDVGSPEVQVAVLTEKITELTAHMQSHKKDFDSRHGLMAMVSRRKRLLKYLSEENHEKFVEISNSLGLRGQK